MHIIKRGSATGLTAGHLRNTIPAGPGSTVNDRSHCQMPNEVVALSRNSNSGALASLAGLFSTARAGLWACPLAALESLKCPTILTLPPSTPCACWSTVYFTRLEIVAVLWPTTFKVEATIEERARSRGFVSHRPISHHARMKGAVPPT